MPAQRVDALLRARRLIRFRDDAGRRRFPSFQFHDGRPLSPTSLVVGALWGALFGFLAHWATRGTRDFASVMRLRAETYHVLVDDAHADDARRVLAHA